MVDNTSVTPERITQLAWGYVPPLVLEAAIRHSIFDVLDEGSKTVQEVHEATGASVRGLSALMDALVGLRLLERDERSRYSLTPESANFLVSTRAEFQGALIRRLSEQVIPKWLKLTEVVGTGQPVQAVNQQETGSHFFRELVRDLFAVNYPAANALARTLNLSGITKFQVLDLAAGSGVWGIALAQVSDHVRVTAVDWPNVIGVTRETVARHGLSDRFSYVEGDLLQIEFGNGFHVAILGHILHSEGEDRSRALISKTFRALRSEGVIVIAEFLVNHDRTGPLNGLLFAVNMLLNTDEGNTYSFEEIGDWLRQEGFVDIRKRDAPGPSPLILATKP